MDNSHGFRCEPKQNTSCNDASALVRAADLPFEILHCFFEGFVQRARTRVLTRVCRRWRSAVLAMPHLLPPTLPLRFFQALILSHANITSMGWLQLPPGLVLPPLCSLDGYDLPRFKGLHNCAPYAALRSLTTLRFRDWGRCVCLSHLLCNNSALLTSLDLTMAIEPDAAVLEPIRSLASIYLSRLVDLKLDLGLRDNKHANEMLYAIIVTHATQLTRLSVAYRQGFAITPDSLTHCSFPALVELCLTVVESSLPATFAERLLAAAPNLSELHLELRHARIGRITHIPGMGRSLAPLVPLMVGLTVSNGIYLQARVLANATRLRDLGAPSCAVCSYAS